MLARHILAHPELVRGRRVRDIGTGSGLVAIAAAMAGAASVTAVDSDAAATVAVELNAAASGVAVDVHAGDGLTGPVPDTDVITAGDLFYDRAVARKALSFLGHCAAAGVTVLVGDPGRRWLPADRLIPVAEDRVPDFERLGVVPAAVYRLGEGRKEELVPLEVRQRRR